MSRPTPAVVRAGAILDLLADHPTQTFTLTDIVRSLKLNRATCHAMLAALVQVGYLYRASDKSYRLGPAFIGIHRLLRRNTSPLQTTLPELRELAEEFDAVCSAVFREGEELVVRERAFATSHFGWVLPSNTRTPLRPPFGVLFHAWSSEAEIRRWLDKLEPSSTSGPQLLASLEFARQHGFFCGFRRDGKVDTHEMPTSDYASKTDVSVEALDPARVYAVAFVGAPVFDAAGRVAFGLTLTDFTRLFSGSELTRMGKSMRASCTRISQHIAGNGN